MTILSINLLIIFLINRLVYKTLGNSEKCPSQYSIYYNARPRKVANFHIRESGMITFFGNFAGKIV